MPFKSQAAGEINQRFLLVQLAQHLRGGLQRRQLPVGIENVELAVVLAEGRAGVGGAGVVGGFVEALVFARRSAFRVMLSRRSRSSVKSCSTSHGAPCVQHDGHQIGRGHLRPDELLRRGQGAQLVAAAASRVMSKYSASSRSVFVTGTRRATPARSVVRGSLS